MLATRFGLEAAAAAHEHDFGTMVALRGNDIVRVPIEDAVRELKTVPAAMLDEMKVLLG
jgi:6-phosphofructokinase 1